MTWRIAVALRAVALTKISRLDFLMRARADALGSDRPFATSVPWRRA